MLASSAEMPQKKKRGADDQEWLVMQKRTFTNWINDKLAVSDHKITDLAKDLDDGTILIELLQNLSGKIVPERWVVNETAASNNEYA